MNTPNIHTIESSTEVIIRIIPLQHPTEVTLTEKVVPLSMAEAERQAIEQMLAHTSGDKSKAAKLLGIGRKTLYRKLEQYGAGQ